MPDLGLDKKSLLRILGLASNSNITTDINTQTVTNKTADVNLNTLKQTTPALGALLKDNGTKFVPLPRGTANQVLTVNSGGTDISWAAATGGGGGTGNVSTTTSNTYGDFDQVFRNTRVKVRNSGNTFDHSLASLSTAARTWSLPDVTDTGVGLAATQTLTNKTVNATNNTLTDTSTAAGDLFKSNGTKFTRLGRGTSGQVLTSGATDVSWAAPTGGAGVVTWQDYDFYIFIDTTDANKIKARNGRTGNIDFTHATDANVVIQAAIDDLSTGSVRNASTGPVPGAGDLYGTWSGGKYGVIRVGPGKFTLKSAVILKSNIAIMGSGWLTTTFVWPDNLLLGNHNQDMFKSSMWDLNSIGGGVRTDAQLEEMDIGIILMNFAVDGNWRNNLIPAANTATSTVSGGKETAGTDSWGHGIALYTIGAYLQNLYVHGCPGAGIIIQTCTRDSIGSYTYNVPFTTPRANPVGVGVLEQPSFILNCNSNGNGRQGFLIRGKIYMNEIWAYYNGEASIDCQTSQYFIGGGWISNFEVYNDGANHGGPDSTIAQYDPYGFEMRLTRGSWVSNGWIEGPWGMSDNLMLGSNSGPYTGLSGYDIDTGCSDCLISDILFDYMRKSAIHIGQGSSRNHISNCVVNSAHPDPAHYVIDSRAVTLYGGHNYVSVHCRDGNSNYEVGSGLVIGAAGVPATWGNIVKYQATNCQPIMEWGNASNGYNTVEIDMTPLFQSPFTQNTIKTGSATIDYLTNSITVRAAADDPSGNNIRGQNGGIISFNGGLTSYNIPHRLYAQPNVVSVTPNTTAASGSYIVNADATNITVTYAAATPSGSNNVWLYWNARVSRS